MRREAQEREHGYKSCCAKVEVSNAGKAKRRQFSDGWNRGHEQSVRSRATDDSVLSRVGGIGAHQLDSQSSDLV